LYNFKGGKKGIPYKEESVDVLKNLGLTSCQARLYLSLISCGACTVKQISIVSKIAREEVYLVLPKLQSLGLIEKILERPTKYKAIPVQECISNLLEERKSKTTELEIRSKEVIQNYKQTNFNGKNSTQLHQFIFVPSKQVLIKRIKKSVINAKKSICVLTSCKRLTHACNSLFETIQDALDRGVKGRAIINLPKGKHLDMINECWSKPSAELRFIPKVPRTVIAMYDKREVYIFTEPDADLTESPALWSNYSSLVNVIDDFFEVLWSTAIERPQYYLDRLQSESIY
jgi:sugar-specific transcriptional regulator TrmB